MGSKIGWTNETWNPVVGCSKVSEGCRNCYAMRVAKGLADKGVDRYQGLTKLVGGKAEWTNVVRCLPDVLEKPLKWRAPRMVFVNSMSDLFHPDVPFEFIDDVFAVMALTRRHTYQILTKRPERMAAYFQRERDFLADGSFLMRHPSHKQPPITVSEWPLPNVWLGTSVENQDAYDKRAPWLLRCPAPVRFLSCEPLLGPIEFYAPWQECKTCGYPFEFDCHDDEFGLPDDWSCPGCGATHGYWVDGDSLGQYAINWVIVGGESGATRREMDMGALTGICEQVVESSECIGGEVSLFVKQDSAFRSEERGRIPDEWWAYKQFPKAGEESDGD